MRSLEDSHPASAKAERRPRLCWPRLPGGLVRRSPTPPLPGPNSWGPTSARAWSWRCASAVDDLRSRLRTSIGARSRHRPPQAGSAPRRRRCIQCGTATRGKRRPRGQSRTSPRVEPAQPQATNLEARSPPARRARDQWRAKPRRATRLDEGPAQSCPLSLSLSASRGPLKRDDLPYEAWLVKPDLESALLDGSQDPRRWMQKNSELHPDDAEHEVDNR